MIRGARLLMAGLAVLFLSGVVRAQDQVRILVPAFSGERQLGIATSNLLRLQVSQTFQAAGTATRAMMVFQDRQLRTPSHEAAQLAGVQLGATAHLVLWGESYEYPDGVVVRAHLSTTPLLYSRVRRPELWTIEVPGPQPIRIRSELPRSLYEFPQIIVPTEAARYFHDVDALIIYRDRQFTQPIGHFMDLYTAREYQEDAALVTSGGVTGWVRLPHLLEQRTEIVEFVSGYFRLLRGDWQGARTMFGNMLRRETITSEMRVDANLFLGLIEEKTGRSGLEYFRRATELNEFDRQAASYLLMGHLAQAMRPGVDRGRAVAALREEVRRQAPLFAEDNPWMAQMRRAAEALGGARGG